ncbi:MAG: hypothetical protein EAX96_18370 [Candidatus Lokiarchaeota archaeon]|nr:hypothetical protein [Candidatus Lokiarchaeota archaeon]
MVVILVTMWCPYSKGLELGKKFLELQSKFPIQPFEKQLVIGAGRPVKGAYKLIYVVGAKTEKYEETYSLVAKRMSFYAEIEGFEYEIETLMSARKMIEGEGLKMPR